MIVYVLTVVVFAAILLFAFRSMGGETVDDTAAAQFMDDVVGWVRVQADNVADLAGDTPPTADRPPLADRARAARKAISGYAQQMQRLDVDDPGGEAARVRALVTEAIESLGWACRMAEASDMNQGVRAAAAALHDHAVGALDAAAGAAAQPSA